MIPHGVLLDWERVGLGTPALDLAIAPYGLPTYDQAAKMATAYDEGGVSPADLMVAKAWSLVEFAALGTATADSNDPRGRRRGEVVDTLRPMAGLWLESVAAVLP